MTAACVLGMVNRLYRLIVLMQTRSSLAGQLEQAGGRCPAVSTLSHLLNQLVPLPKHQKALVLVQLSE